MIAVNTLFGVDAAVLGPLLCLVSATLVQPVVLRLLRRAGSVDLPGTRSSHHVPTLRGGGIAVVVGVLLGVSLIPHGLWLPFVLAVAVFSVIGLAEDLKGLSVRSRLLAQLCAGLGVGALLVVTDPLPAAPLAVVLLALWITGYVNAFNFMDGINGISGAHALVGGVAFACIGFWYGELSLQGAGATLAAGGLAFLPWNAVRAKVFLGDVGSYAIGAGLAVAAAYALMLGVPIEAAAAPLALYLADTSWTLQRRIRAGEPWTRPHRTHVYQRIGDLGWSHVHVTVFTAALGVVLSALGLVSLLGSWQLRLFADLLAAGVIAAYLTAPRWLAPQRTTEGVA